MSDTVGSRRGELLAIKLRALVSDHLGERIAAEPGGFANGAALVVDSRAWVLVDGDAERSLGPALAWAIRHGATSLDLIAESHTGLLARRAERFSYPIVVWYPVERTLLPAVAEPLPTPPAAPAAHLEVRGVIDEAGATLTVEHGVVTGEVRGLEVCRVVDSPTSGYFDEPDGGEPISSMSASMHGGEGDEPRGVIVEVGVGGPDREAFRIIHGDLPTVTALAEVVATVSGHRTPGAAPHPLNRLAQERLLRWRLQVEPSLVELHRVDPAEPPLPRLGLNEVVPCVAAGIDLDGRTRVLVCSVGVDLDLIPFVADVQAITDDPIVVVLPTRDLMSITRELAALLASPVTFATVDW
ncbi:MAG: hypothetical protein ABWZ99_17060 [Ilumatobacteraceae bacterium]